MARGLLRSASWSEAHAGQAARGGACPAFPGCAGVGREQQWRPSTLATSRHRGTRCWEAADRSLRRPQREWARLPPPGTLQPTRRACARADGIVLLVLAAHHRPRFAGAAMSRGGRGRAPTPACRQPELPPRGVPCRAFSRSAYLRSTVSPRGTPWAFYTRSVPQRLHPRGLRAVLNHGRVDREVEGDAEPTDGRAATCRPLHVERRPTRRRRSPRRVALRARPLALGHPADVARPANIRCATA
jgi:hypothetical protein